ncbi:bifunctional helix-turn-helix transcriptional regulator/GNAT family N-acetyltransferase [Phenylobacterium sp. VNQ135]|uniref:bifunctional helix-turn-helix transcriptional regulator/GNAT family N-acetyltransferase n=1 Tax=Phenylobacterium sp. VNQ135 TaxID=3400922 RepID=UPI003C00AC40
MTAPQDTVAVIRRFNRFYTRAIGVMDRGHVGSPYTLAETRTLYEIATSGGVTPKTVTERTGLDPGYLSRILKRLERDGLVVRERSDVDGRSVVLRPSGEGARLMAELQQRSNIQAEGLIAELSAAQRAELAAALETVEALLDGGRAPEPWRLAEPELGDYGWVVQSHGEIYGREYHWDHRFEALVARIVADFVDDFDPARERCWIAKQGGRNIGSIFLAKGDDETAKLRLLLVDPSARGLGVGRKLVDECIAFARQAGYRRMTLWTQSILTAARAIYASVGFELKDSWPNRDFGGFGLTSERWDLDL